MDASTQLAGVVRLLDSVLQNSSRGHREMEKKLANSPRRPARIERARKCAAASEGGGSSRQDTVLEAPGG